MKPSQKAPKYNAAGKPTVKNRSGRIIALVLVASGLFLLVASIVLWLSKTIENFQVDLAQSGPPRVGAKMADFSLDDLNGIEVRLSDYQGRPVLINFWATWCPPCKAEMPLLADLYLEYKETGFTILAVDVGESNNLVSEFVRENNLPFPVLLDPAYEFSDGLSITGYPTSILVGSDGKIKVIHQGMFTDAALEREVLPYLQP